MVLLAWDQLLLLVIWCKLPTILAGYESRSAAWHWPTIIRDSRSWNCYIQLRWVHRRVWCCEVWFLILSKHHIISSAIDLPDVVTLGFYSVRAKVAGKEATKWVCGAAPPEHQTPLREEGEEAENNSGVYRECTRQHIIKELFTLLLSCAMHINSMVLLHSSTCASAKDGQQHNG